MSNNPLTPGGHAHQKIIIGGSPRASLSDSISTSQGARQYTIGWICTPGKELVAAKCMLDEEHDMKQYDPIAGDTNHYTLGRIAEHNIVIACLPKAKYGATTVTGVALNMLNSFPAVRFGLLVGIGSGIPSESRDIRLGDVVVSVPTGTLGGVVKYDQGKMHAGSFQRTGHLNAPPAALLSAVSNLQSMLELGSAELERHLQFPIELLPAIRDKYAFPGRECDMLFQPHYHHITGSPQCTNCDLSQCITRESRTSNEPLVHHGLIASGDQVVRDAVRRDLLKKDYDAICIDTEAAGLMNTFPCLVIRGIADYADSHRNEQWNGYAAMAAAAYAKELLALLPNDRVHHSDTAADVLDLDLNTIGTSGLALDFSDTESLSSTLVHTLEPGVVDATVNELTRILASNRSLRLLYSAAKLRMTESVFMRHLITALNLLSKSLQKLGQIPLERAIAWILSHYKSRIASSIYDMINTEGHTTDVLRLPLYQVSSAQQRHLMRFINEKFPVTEQRSGRAQTPQVEDEDNELPPNEDQEEDTEDPPAAEELMDLSQVEQILCSGMAFEKMHKQLKSTFFPSPSQSIKKVLRRHIWQNNPPTSIICLIEWQILEYLGHEGITIDDLDSTFTLTGELDCCCAVRLGDYMSCVWSTGKELLDAVTASITRFLAGDSTSPEDQSIVTSGYQIKIDLSPMSVNSKEHALVKISGTFDQISETLEQLAWLAATLRPHIEGQLTVSDIAFRAQQTEIEDSSHQLHNETIFRLSLFGQDKVPLPDSHEAGQCWTSMFTESVLAYGFSLPGNCRPDGVVGLEIPFEIMATFAGVKFPILLGDRIAFASSSSVLIPEVTVGDSIQWHLIKSENWVEQVTKKAKVLDPQLETLDISNLINSRAFLGYCRASEVLLGTTDFQDADISEAGVPRTGSKIALKLEGPITMAVGFKGYTTMTGGTTWKFNRGETAMISAQSLGLDERLKRAAKSSALLYDPEACIAFLVSELSVILQLVAVYLQKDSRLKRSKIPFAAISANGGEAAYEAIKKANNLMVPLGIGSPRKYVDIVDSFLTITEQRKTQVSTRRQYGEISLKDGLRGWDYTDVQEKNYEIWERELRTELLKSRPIWWKLFKGSETLVLFARMTKFPIRSSSINNEPFHCSAWEEIPRGRHLLLANMTQLQHLKRELCQNAHKYPTRYMLTNKLAWARPIHSRLFEQRCRDGGSCNPLQTMCKVGLRGKKLGNISTILGGNAKTYRQHPGELEPSGAVLFADDPSAFEHRHCWRYPVQVISEPDWNFIFISFGLAYFILAWGASRALCLLYQTTVHIIDKTKGYLDPPAL